MATPQPAVRLLSGGNQQKVVIAKWLGTDPDVLIMDEPTAGVDIGTKTEILDMIRDLADAGKGVIVISSEYPELLAVSDRILVLRDGAVSTEDLARARHRRRGIPPTRRPRSLSHDHTPPPPPHRVAAGRRAAPLRPAKALDWRRYVIYIGFVVVFLFFAVLLGDHGFLSSNNLLNIFRQSATITMIAVGMTYVIACAEIDLQRRVGGRASPASSPPWRIADYGLLPGILAGLLVGSGGRRHQRRAGQPAQHPVLPGHPRHARHRRRGGAVDHRLRAAADPDRRLQPDLRWRQLRPRPRPARLDGDRSSPSAPSA